MSFHDELAIDCPYCNAPVPIEADPELAGQRFIEDCPVCCSPIELSLSLDSEGAWRLDAKRDDE